MINMYLCKIPGEKLHLNTILHHGFSQIYTNVFETIYYTLIKYHVLAMFILNGVFFNYSSILISIAKYLNFVSDGIQTNHFFQILKKISIFLNFFHIFSEKELKNKKIATISSIIIGLSIILNFKNSGNFDEPKQQIYVINTIAEFLKNALIVPRLWLNDNAIIWDVGFGCESESIDQGRSYSQMDIDISDCFFSRYSLYNGDGGVIYVYGGSYSMNINYSMFYNCVCSSQGGAIYFYSTNSSLRMICANRCSASWYHFAYLSASQVNQVEYLSVSKCSHTTSGYYPIYLYTGYQRVDNTNSSMNNAYMGSGIGIWSPSTFTSSHCTFSNNKVSDSVCIFIWSDPGTISMSYANIVHNNSPKDGIVSVFKGGPIKMMYCIFQNNQNYLFYLETGSLEVSHSFIDHSSSSFSSENAVSTLNNNSLTNRITYQIQFFNSHHCNADIPLPQRTSDQTPSPKSILEETPMITLERSLLNTPNESPYSTPEESPMRSFEETIRSTNEETFIKTYMRTIDQTIRETPKETIPRTYAELICSNQMVNKREIGVIFSFLSILYIQ